MARGPDAVTYAEPLDTGSGLNSAELGFTQGLERIIDRTMDSHAWGKPFVYGIHQAMSPRMIEILIRRYEGAGWSEARIREGDTGAYMMVLRP